MRENESEQSGLIHAFVLNGSGGARQIGYGDLHELQLAANESIWLHWDRSQPQAQDWLRRRSGLTAFACDVLLEENTRPRMLALEQEELLLFLRGVNLNPDAEPEDMVSVRVFADRQRVISLRLRPLRSTEVVIQLLLEGRGPKSASELLLYLAEAMTERVDDLVTQLAERIDAEEERIEGDPQSTLEHASMLCLRRQAASLRRFLLPQRELYGQMTRTHFSWFAEDDTEYWNELSNRLTRYLEELEMIRERVNLVVESEHRRLNQRMNRTMYLLAIITGFFLPLSFLTGLLGINVGGIPGAEFSYGFVVACLLIGSVALLQWWLLRRLRWV
ncbi:zinc transporter ZntB [Stutzerimonas decontaminans]|jgi:zinc transporter|uniref:Zinc transporter ZntB n=2 Tax=Stutzerimonas TaxID=2901164 RepID=A0ABX4VUJ2_9GAMM|nr:CorA family divalent cation transporter [Stutzerimonas decontaminans]AHY43110.1 CmaX protein [Stutzerimonas decontaminans]MCQ4246716.1 zinc transporter ZntB [Stutzerimonas decontaminans]MCW8157912.1 zinc transporter ZntB [Stutzerimonas stutzeri]PNF83853.1 zinc transporter ZntB [Stutzerimonas decontaminans]